jgi:hypothetical protein
MSEPIIDLCLANFLERFFKDIYPREPNFGTGIGLKVLLEVFGYYNRNSPKNGLSDISDEFYKCIEPTLNSAAITTSTELGYAIFYIVILTAVLMIFVVIIIVLLDKKQQPGIIIGLILFFSIIYIIVGWLLIHNSFLIISNEITNIEKIADNCINQAITNTEILFLNQEKVIDESLCNYQ